MHFLSLTDEQQTEAIEQMSRAELGDIIKLSLAGKVATRAYNQLYADLTSGDETYRWLKAAEGKTVIKHCGPGHGWKHFRKFEADELKTAQDLWTELCFKAENPELPEVVEGEILPVETSNFDRVEVSTVVETSITKAVSLAEFSKKFAQVSVICAAQAGAEFAQIKEQCERGEWMKVLQVLPFGKDTVYKYIKIAEELQTRLSEGSADVNLLDLPSPQELISGDHADVINQVNAVTGEQSLRQLYFEWGILKQPGKTGGDTSGTPPKLLPSGETKNHLLATQCLGKIQKDLNIFVVDNTTQKIKHLKPEELEALLSTFKLAARAIEDQIKAG